MNQTLKIPAERVGVLIGKDGETKRALEERTGIMISVDSEEGDVEIDHTHAKDQGMAMSALNVVQAIGRGFSPQKAFKLLDEDYLLEILDIRDYVGKKQEHVV